jgi:glyoxylase-like metal-dependent hydrolase (beta-lactamase superfamily II)
MGWMVKERLLIVGLLLGVVWLGSGFQQTTGASRVEKLVTATSGFTGYDPSRDKQEVVDAEQPLTKITNDVYQVAGFRGLVSAVYLIQNPQPVLIDSGSRYGMAALEKNLARLGLSIADIELVIGTHAHWDHIDGAGTLAGDQRFCGKFALFEKDVPAAERDDRIATAAENIYRAESVPVKVDIILKEGPFESGGRKFEIYHTPGHTPGSISVLTESDGLRLLFSGDSVRGWYLPGSGSDIRAWESSLEKMMRLNFDLGLEGHGARYQKGIIRDQLQLVRRGYLVWPAR